VPNVPKSGEKNAALGPSSKTERPAAEEARKLVERAQRGDVAAYEALVRSHQQRVFAILGGILRRREDIEDVAQQVFLKAYLALGQFDRRAAFSTWLYKIAVNECWDYLRKKKVRPLVYEADLSEDQARQLEGIPRSEAIDAAHRAEVRQLVDRLLAELGEQDRMMLLLKEVEGFSVEEVGDLLGLNVNTVKVRLFRARGKLMELYNRKLRER
jgi:RNA polymerase sigma-70 factor (ECF subfamily)